MEVVALERGEETFCFVADGQLVGIGKPMSLKQCELVAKMRLCLGSRWGRTFM